MSGWHANCFVCCENKRDGIGRRADETRETQMSLASALKKGQAAIDTLGDWDPFPETGNERAAQAKLPAPRSAPANVNAAAERSPARLRAVREAAEKPEAARAVPAPTQARAVLSSKPAAKNVAAARNRGKASWLHEGLPQHGRVNAAQYIREFERFSAEESRRAVADIVMDVNPNEIEGVAKLAARIKGRYLAKLLDLGNPAKSTVQDTEVRELTRYRETYEELARGLDILKTAIEAGDVGVSGMVRR
ncbi:hypothetical protein BAL199_21999 [alpha proteobacterium BAL199]|jgi:hypothetical protein|nr:hypothetical protein BAL199_21999 [alpha proteobacterium BAL199]